MIKAEIIAHEGNPGPNWLDHCRTILSPGGMTALIVVVAIAAVVIGTHTNFLQAKQTTGNASQQASNLPMSNLQVQPLRSTASSAASDEAAVQPAAIGTPSTGTAQNASSGNLGGSDASTLGTSGSTSTQRSSSNQNQYSGKRIDNIVQTTLRSVKDSVNLTQDLFNTTQ